MKTKKRSSGSEVNTQNKQGLFKAIGSLLFLTFIGKGAFAAEFSSGPGILSTGTGYVIVGMILFIGISVYMILQAKNVLEQNGKSIEFSFSSFQWSAKHSKAAGIFLFLIVIVAVIWALNF